MVVPKTTETIEMEVTRQDRTYKGYTSNPIPIHHFYPIYSSVSYDMRLLERGLHFRKKDVEMG